MFTLLATCTLALGCRDSVGSEGGRPQFSEGAAATVAIVRCEGDPQTRELVCTAVEPHGFSTSQGPAKAIVGNPDVQLSSYNVVYDTTTLIFSFDAKVKNQLTEAIGTPNGTTVTGLKVYYETGPSATSYYSPGDTGTVTVNNADGTGNFTKANQPYHLYNELVVPNDTTDRKRWELRIPRAVKTFAFQVRVFTARPSEVPVPSSPPTAFISPSLVATLYADSNLVYSHPRGSGRYPRNVVQVAFRVDASPEERQAAIDAIKGEVVGGVRVGDSDGYYYIRIPLNGTAAPVWQAVDVLNGLPQVEYAAPDFDDMGSLYQRPNDGSGWAKTNWSLNPDSSFGSNWSMELIAAPYAWGCSTGADSTSVAVVDLDSVHAQTINEVIRSPANNNAGTTGLMWRGKFSSFDASRAGVDSTAAQKRANTVTDLTNALRAGAAVVNISTGGAYFDSITRAPRAPVDNAADSVQASYTRVRWRDYIRRAENAVPSVRPLYVIAAGNNQVRAHLSGLPMLRRDPTIQARILVVGGTDSIRGTGQDRRLYANFSNPLNKGSNFGPLVEIAAPGNNVHVGSVLVRGTSFAAPHVSAAAGLLKSFDPRLTAAEIRTLLINGAVAGGRRADSIPILNIHESLKLASRTVGAGICGNRLYLDASNNIVIERTLTQDETLPTAGSSLNTVWYFHSTHGGRRIVYGTIDGAPERALTLGPTGWVDGVNVITDSTETRSGAAWSLGGVSHDGDTIAYIHQPYDEFAPVHEVVTLHLADAYAAWDITLDSVSGNAPNFHAVSGTTEFTSRAAYHPRGHELMYVAKNGYFGGTYNIYVYSFATGTSQLWQSITASSNGMTVGYSEDGTEVIVRYNDDPVIATIEYRSRATGSIIRSRSGDQILGGFSPYRRPAASRRR
jgi:hypothetical protein